MGYLSESEIASLGFKSLGRDVKISDKASLYNIEEIEIGDFSRVDDFCVLSGKISLGRNVHIAVFCNLAGGQEGIVIEDFAGIAYGVHIFSQSDDYSGAFLTNPTVPDEYKNETKAAVHIGRHVIIGTGSIVIPGVHIAEGCAIGAASLVAQSTKEWLMYMGTPARPFGERKKDLLIKEAEYTRRS